MEQGQESENWKGYVNWRNMSAVRGKHGGVLAAAFVLAAEILENLAFLANASNLVTYLLGFMHFSPSRSATAVTNFMGTAFLLALLGGFLSDAFFTSYAIFLVSALLEFLGLVMLTVQAKSSSLKPPPCSPLDPNSALCEELSGGHAALFFGGLYIVALGVGGIKGSLAPHGGEQFDDDTARGRIQRSTFFNYFIFCLSCGGLIAVTFVVWLEDNKGWEWGFGVSTIAIFISMLVFLAGTATYRNKIPTGSPLTIISKVVAAAITNRKYPRSPSTAVVDKAPSPAQAPKDMAKQGEINRDGTVTLERPSEELRFLNRAVDGKPIHKALACTVVDVEEVKVVLKVLPIFLATIMLNCCLSQLSTFSVQQAATMNTRVGSLKVPPASLPIFPIVFIMLLAPIYDHVLVPFARRVTKTEMGISHLQRVGVGLVMSIVAMAVAALVEIKRKRVATHAGLLDSGEALPISFFWIAFQYLFLGSADLFTLAGLLEFMFTEAPARMRSMATSLSWASLALGYYLSSVLVSIVNDVTGTRGHKGWLSGSNLNHYHLERFYWLMCVLSILNYIVYLVLAARYRYRSTTFTS